MKLSYTLYVHYPWQKSEEIPNQNLELASKLAKKTEEMNPNRNLELASIQQLKKTSVAMNPNRNLELFSIQQLKKKSEETSPDQNLNLSSTYDEMFSNKNTESTEKPKTTFKEKKSEYVFKLKWDPVEWSWNKKLKKS